MAAIHAITTPSLGDRSYLAADGPVGVVIDPQRDIDRVLGLAASRGITISHVFETHIHNDYVTGGLALARATGAAYHVNAADKVSFERAPIADGAIVEAGGMRIRAIATPGHTFTHLSYELAAGGKVIAVFTGGSMLNGSTGRTDLLGGGYAEQLARAQYASARRLAAELPGSAQVCPTHGFGSFCSAAPGTGSSSTIADEKRVNAALTTDQDEFVATMLGGLDAYPAYYAHMAAANSAGPAAPVLDPPRPADAAGLCRRIGAGEWVVDLRSRLAFAAGHLPGALGFESGDAMATYLGWLIPWGTPLTLIGATAGDVATAQRELARIGIDQIAAAATGSVREWSGGQPLSSYRVLPFAALPPASRSDALVLDVRRRAEREAARLDGTVHIPLHELPARIGELPDAQIWVHCQSGYRAAVAASLLDAAGRDVLLIDGDLDQALEAGITGLATALD